MNLITPGKIQDPGSVPFFAENFEPDSWSHDADSGDDEWGIVTTSCHSPTHAWFSPDLDSIKDSSLYTPSMAIGATSQLTFWQRYDFEADYDGGVIEISTDGGSSYEDLGDYITQNGYTHTLSTESESPIGGQEAWSGASDWHEVVVDLSAFGPANVTIRFPPSGLLLGLLLLLGMARRSRFCPLSFPRTGKVPGLSPKIPQPPHSIPKKAH